MKREMPFNQLTLFIIYFSVPSVNSVANFSLCLSAFVAGFQSIKNNKICKTNPISDMSKMSLTNYMTKSCGNNSDLLTMEKQTQNKANQSQILVKMGNYKQDS
ncbi:MAG: hypothetical protein PHY02_07885 [Phycisphaerae bacterium]|nr:hypothetical protein [Phycisphaerae bacterium]